jgi:uncharacterized protein (TIGR02001 family)
MNFCFGTVLAFTYFSMENLMKLSTSKLAVIAASLVASGAFAQAKAPEPDWSVSYNLGAVSEYRYRGISQSAKHPALQGGVDASHKSGFYVGAWGSSIEWIKDSPTAPKSAKGPVEIDLYGGYKGDIGKTGLSYDVGLLQYWYAGNNLKNANIAGVVEPNTLEVYGALSYGVVTAKYSNSTTNLFGIANSKGSEYLDLSATFDLGNGWSVVPHIGHQVIKHNASYADYSVAVNKDMDGLVLSATLIDTNWKRGARAAYQLPGSGTRNLAGSTLVLGIKKNF